MSLETSNPLMTEGKVKAIKSEEVANTMQIQYLSDITQNENLECSQNSIQKKFFYYPIFSKNAKILYHENLYPYSKTIMLSYRKGGRIDLFTKSLFSEKNS